MFPIESVEPSEEESWYDVLKRFLFSNLLICKLDMEVDKSSKSNNLVVNQSTDHFQPKIANGVQNVKEQQIDKGNHKTI